jgi:TonB-dependent SusC/RagA subfamily outer membrane receptor
MQRALRRFPVSVVISVLVAIALAPPLAAQTTGVIEGRVVTAVTSRPLAEVQLSVTGTTLGARTDEAGRFRIPAVPAGAHRVRAQRIGYNSATQSVTVVAGQTVTAEFGLREAALSLEAVVVTGTAAETRQREVGNATATIDARALELAPVTNTQEMITGRAPGITVLSNSGQPGAGGSIRLRGITSISQGTNPVVYVDGIRIYSENTRYTPGARQNTLPINDIKAEDIERIEIVKGAAATTLYGTEASNGVIQIFTKKGTSGRPQWALEVGGGANFQGHVGPKSDRAGLFLNRCRGAELVDAFGAAFVDPTCPSSGSWLRTGGLQRYSVSVRGGGESMTYFLSTNYNSEEGVIPTSRGQDGGFRGNFSFTPAKNVLLAVNSAYNKRITNWVPDGNLANGFFLNVARGPNNNFKGGKGECINVTMICTTNGYILEQETTNDADHFITGFTVNWNPTVALTQRVNIGWDYNSSDNKYLLPFGFLNRAAGQLDQGTWNHTKLSLDYAGSFQSKLWRLADVASTLSWGGQVFDDRDRFTRVTGSDFSGPGEPTLASAARVTLNTASRPRVVNAGFFLQEMLGWRDRLFLTGGFRVDGHSAFGEDFGLQTYPKVSASYVISDEGFWPTRWLPTMKLRAALGESGKAPGAFDAIPTWEPVAGDDARPAVTLDQRGNPKLGPERTRELELGFDLGALDNRLGLEFTAFRARTYGALIGVRYPPSEGFDEAQLENVGTIENQGIEAQINAGLLRGDRIDWQARLSFTNLKSEALDLGQVGGQPRQIPTGEDTWVRVGYPIATIFGARVTNPDAFADPIVAIDQEIGPMYPTRLIGVGTTLTIGRTLTLDAQGEYQGGAYLSNFIGYQNANRFIWQPCYATQQKLRQAYGPDGVSGTADDGPASAVADVTARDRARCSLNRTAQNSNFWIAKTDFFKLRSVSLTYNVPQRLVVAGNTATVTIAGRNLYRWTKYDGVDPESRDAQDAALSGGAQYQLGRREYYQLPPYRSVLLTLRATF